MSELQYEKGYVAVIDILGFSKYIADPSNIEHTINTFSFINEITNIFNQSNTKTRMSFFSDSIFIATDKIEHLYMPIMFAEMKAYKELNLLVRGAITYGQYYYDKNIMFGPAIVDAYKMQENDANYARIIIDKRININNKSLLYYVDTDGYTCFNPYDINVYTSAEAEQGVLSEISEEYDKHNYSELLIKRNEIIKMIKQYKNTPYIEKYIWRIKPYNYTCKQLFNSKSDELLIEDNDYRILKQTKSTISDLLINDTDY